MENNMGHYAKVNENNIVTNVVSANQEWIDSYVDNSPGRWIQTSINTQGGVHKLGGTALRKNYAGKGYSYDDERDAFIPPKLYSSWVLNEDTCLWEPPIPMPSDATDTKVYLWNEETVNWVLKP
jgi:hypothetical protein